MDGWIYLKDDLKVCIDADLDQWETLKPGTFTYEGVIPPAHPWFGFSCTSKPYEGLRCMYNYVAKVTIEGDLIQDRFYFAGRELKVHSIFDAREVLRSFTRKVVEKGLRHWKAPAAVKRWCKNGTAIPDKILAPLRTENDKKGKNSPPHLDIVAAVVEAQNEDPATAALHASLYIPSWVKEAPLEVDVNRDALYNQWLKELFDENI